jgi:hypothetical protein
MDPILQVEIARPQDGIVDRGRAGLQVRQGDAVLLEREEGRLDLELVLERRRRDEIAF